MNCRVLCPVVFVGTLLTGGWLGTTTCARADLVHYFELNDQFQEGGGPPALVDYGGSFSSSTYSFGAASNQGLSLSGASINGIQYSILIDFMFTTAPATFGKILDFKNLVEDTGLYLTSGGFLLFFGPGELGATSIAQDVLVRMVLTRDSAEQVGVYLNGDLEFDFDDSGVGAEFARLSPNTIQFFNDDDVTGNGLSPERFPGLVDRIAIYDSPLSAAEVLALGGPGPLGPAAIPEPSSLLLAGVAGLGLAAFRRWRGKPKSSEPAPPVV